MLLEIRNRLAHQRDRDIHYQQTVRELESLAGFTEEDLRKAEVQEQFKDRLASIESIIRRAVEHAVAARGGEYSGNDEEIPVEELAFIDFLKTLKSSVLYIQRQLAHEEMLQTFVSRRDLDSQLRQYAEACERCDENMVLSSLAIVQERIRLFNKAFPNGTGK